MSDAERDSAGLTGMGEMPLEGRVALVTGASSGIRQATARALAAAGARVGLAARRAERLQELEQEIARGGEAIALPTDVSDYAQAETMARRAEETFGGVDVADPRNNSLCDGAIGKYGAEPEASCSMNIGDS